MSLIKNKITPKSTSINAGLFEILIILFLVSILYSKTLLTIVEILLFSMSFFIIDNNFKLKRRKDIIFNFHRYIKSPQYWTLNLFFIAVLISGINSTNLTEWFHHLILKLPFLFLPFAFFPIGKISEDKYLRFFYYFIIIIFCSSVGVFTEYINSYPELITKIKTGQSINTPIDHIKYSLLLSIAVIASFELYIKNYYLKYPFERILIGITGIGIFIFLHFISIRSGIATVYFALTILIIKDFWLKEKTVVFISILILFISLILFYNTIPLFHDKIEYMKYDLKMYKNDRGENYSDAERLYSWKAGMALIKKKPFFGTGIGDLKDELKTTYKKIFPDKNLKVKYPHNQFIFTMSGMGLAGLVFLIIAIFFPLLSNKNYHNSLFLGIMIILISSFIVENTIERAYSTAFYLFFVLISLNSANLQKHYN